MKVLLHFGDPCVHCDTPHDDVQSGSCLGDPAKAVPMRWRSLGVRWDGVEHFLIQMSDGSLTDFWNHIAYKTAYYGYLAGVRFDPTLRRQS